MRKNLIICMFVFCFVSLVACKNSSATSITTFTSTESTLLSDTHLELGFDLDYDSEIVEDINSKYNFNGAVYILFEFDFPSQVEFNYADYHDSMDEVTIYSSGFNGQTVFEYIVSDLQQYCTEITMGDFVDGTVYYMDNDGNTVSVMNVSDTEIQLRIDRHPTNYNNSEDSIDMYFIYPLSTVGTSLEEVRQKIINGVPSSDVSEISDGKFTYTYLGYTFMLDQSQSTLIEGNYHYLTIHVDNS
ncbi:hypothetical protein RJI07_07165 [Mycoplasmatota bacterium WC30]